MGSLNRSKLAPQHHCPEPLGGRTTVSIFRPRPGGGQAETDGTGGSPRLSAPELFRIICSRNRERDPETVLLYLSGQRRREEGRSRGRRCCRTQPVFSAEDSGMFPSSAWSSCAVTPSIPGLGGQPSPQLGRTSNQINSCKSQNSFV